MLYSSSERLTGGVNIYLYRRVGVLATDCALRL